MIESSPSGGSILCETGEGVEFCGTMLKLTRFQVTFEVHNPTCSLRTSEVLKDLKILVQDQPIYSGRAVVNNLVNTEAGVVCEATLEDACFDEGLFAADRWGTRLREEFRRFVTTSQQMFRIMPEFRVAVADLQMVLLDLRQWLEHIELGVQSQPPGDRGEIELRVLRELQDAALPMIGSLFERFEETTKKVREELRPAHSLYAKRQLHPVVLCSPFMNRAFQKPLGYAGDYEMVNMMVGDPNDYAGSSIFAKLLNAFFLHTPPVVAHRNRIDHLIQLLIQETGRVVCRGGNAKIFNLGCGPVKEVQRFMQQSALSRNADFTFLDFNDETIEYVKRVMEQARSQYNRNTQVKVIKKSVVQLLKDASKPALKKAVGDYDFVYCAGLFDYLADSVCARLVKSFYDMVAPGGLMVVSNVEKSHPSRGWMEFVVDWHLCYRDARQMTALIPKSAPPDSARIIAEDIGVNIFLEVRKPENA